MGHGVVDEAGQGGNFRDGQRGIDGADRFARAADDGAGVGLRAQGDLHREHVGIRLLRVDDVELWAGGFAHGEMLYVCGDADDGEGGIFRRRKLD